MTTKRGYFSKAPDKKIVTSANYIPVSSRKSGSSINSTLYGTSTNYIPVSGSKFHATSVKSTSYVTSANVIPINSKNPVKVNHIVGNSEDVKPVLSTDSKSSVRKSQTSSNEPLPFISSELVGKFINDQRQKTIVVEDFEWRRLYEANLDPRTAAIYFDLDHNIETYENSPFYYEKIDPILKYIMKTAKEGTSLRDAIQGCELVTNRGTLAKIATFNTLDTFYDSKLYCQVVFCKFNGIIFACESLTEEYRLSVLNASKKQKRHTYWGHKFEQYMTTEFPNDEPDLNKPVSTLSQQYGVFKAQITGSKDRKLSSFINAEMDGLDKNGNFVEFKTANQKNPKHTKMNWDNANKSIWWAQSALANVKYIIVGMHKGSGVVTKIVKMHIPKKRNDSNKEQWKREDCVNFFLDFYGEVRELLDSKPDGALLKVDFFVKPQKEIKKTWVDDNERDKYEFLLPEFTEQFSAK